MLFLALGGTSIYAAIRYAVGADAYGYLGLGDVFVFLFFGLLSMPGSYFLYARSLDAALPLPACTCRMSQQHARHPKRRAQGQAHDPRAYRTAPAKRYHFALIASGAGLMLCYSFFRGEPSARLLYIASFAPPTRHLFSVLRVRECRDFDGQLKVVSLSTFAMSALFFVGEIFRLNSA